MEPIERALAELPPTPLLNSYWVSPGRLLAGEYPGSMSRADAMARIEKLLRAGVTSFIDLTEEGELPEYDNLLPELTEQHIQYRRLPILDHGLPDSPGHMSEILDAIEAGLAAGRCVYVHCRAGVGRTGMTVGCHLIRGGLASEAALDRLQTLWQQCGRSHGWPTVPETSEQVEFVRQWREEPRAPRAASINDVGRYEGALIGLAIGDALGTLVAVSNFDAATLTARAHDPGVLATGADTAMTRAVAESLLAQGAHDSRDQMQRYLQWSRTGPTTPVPPELKRALAAWQWSKKPNAGSHDPKNLDPHTLARTLAVAMFVRSDPQGAIDLSAEVSRTTLQSPIVLDLCRVWAALLIDALAGVEKASLAAFNGPAMQQARSRMFKKPVQMLIDGGSRAESEQGGDALSVTRIAVATFARTHSVRDALLQVVTSSRAAPAAAALCGALCGAHYGIETIPPEWRRQLSDDAVLRSLARHLLG